jgi:hypothetical protein
MRRILIVLMAAAFAATACGGGSKPLHPGTAVATLAPTADSPSPTSATPVDLEITKWAVHASELDLDVYNPNAAYGLVRSGFDLAVIGKGGDVLNDFGSDGMPGAMCCTIYLLPPKSHYGMGFELDHPGTVKRLELTPSGDWVKWSDITTQQAKVTHPHVSVDIINSPSATGFVQTTGDEVLNVVVAVEAKLDGKLTVLTDVVSCVRPHTKKPFEITANGSAQGSSISIMRVVAYPTTAHGAGDTESPPGC